MEESEVERINDAMTNKLMPAIIIVGIYMVVGLVGNPLVIYYYGFRSRSTSSFHFILALAIFDLIVCCISMPLEIFDMTNFYKFESAAACKILRFVNYFATIGSGGILMALAVDRYRKICKPLRKQFTLQLTRIIIGCVCLFSFCVSWPSLVFYNIVNVNITKVPGLTGSDCTMIRDEDYKVLITIYNIFLFLCFIVGVTSLIILYSLVGKSLFQIRCCNIKRIQSNETPSRRYSPADTIASEIESYAHDAEDSKRQSVSYGIEIQIKDEHDSKPLATITELHTENNKKSRPSSDHFDHAQIEMNFVNKTKHAITNQSISYTEDTLKNNDDSDPSINRRSTEIILKEGKDGVTVAKLSNGMSNGSHKKHKKKHLNLKTTPSENSLSNERNLSRISRKTLTKRLNTKQYTIMMIAITIAFIISFLPYLALVTWRTVATDYEVDILSDPELVAFQIFIRSFLISSAVNPLIYGFLNTEFKKFIKKRFCCCCDATTTTPDISSSYSI